MVEHRLYEEFEIRGQVLDTESTVENSQMFDSNEDTRSESDDEIYMENVTQTEGNIIEW